MPTRILIISDTHGLIRPEIAGLVPRFDYILHAGDIGNRDTCQRLKGLNSHILAIAGNVDRSLISEGFTQELAWRHAGYRFKIVHDIDAFGRRGLSEWDFVIFGHSHKPGEFFSEGTHFINPGSVGPRRFRLPISYATLEIGEPSGYAVRFHEIPFRK